MIIDETDGSFFIILTLIWNVDLFNNYFIINLIEKGGDYNMKKLISFLLTLIVLVTLVSSATMEEIGHTEGWTYKVKEDGTAELCSTSRCIPVEDLIIPDTVNGIKVTSIADDAFGSNPSNYPFYSVVVPEGVTSIGTRLFQNFPNLTSVTLPSTLTAISESAFDHCYELTSIVIPEGVEVIGKNAFSCCKHLKEVVFPTSLISIEESAFDLCEELESISIKGNLQSIAKWAFDSCENLSEVNLPDTLTTMGEGAFRSCESLQNIVLPASLESVPESVFGGCRHLNTIVIQEGTKSIEHNVFSNLDSLRTITIPASVTNIDDHFSVGYNTEIIVPRNSFAAQYFIDHHHEDQLVYSD